MLQRQRVVDFPLEATKQRRLLLVDLALAPRQQLQLRVTLLRHSGGFNFAASSDTASKPSFGFGGGTSTADGKGAISLGTTNTDSTAASKPTFGFGSTEAASADDKQAPSFGVTTDSAKTAGGFSFGKTDSDAQQLLPPNHQLRLHWWF